MKIKIEKTHIFFTIIFQKLDSSKAFDAILNSKNIKQLNKAAADLINS